MNRATAILIVWWCSGAVAGSHFVGGTVHLVQSSHSDIGYMGSIVNDTKVDTAIYSSALDIANESTGFKFSSEDVWTFNEYCRLAPSRQTEIDNCVNQGRFTVSATYTQPYENLIPGEQMVRQMYLGRKNMLHKYPSAKQFFSARFDVDPPQRALQIHQIQQKSGINYMFISRLYSSLPGIPDKSIIKWKSPDGSYSYSWAITHYAEYSFEAKHTINMSSTSSIKSYIDSWDSYYSSRNLNKHLILMLDDDALKPANYDKQITAWNSWAAINRYPELKYSSFEEAMDSIVAGGGNFDTASGERPNLWLYEASPTNHYAMSNLREGNNALLAAEAFSTFRAVLEKGFQNYPTASLNKSWQEMNYICHGWQNDCVDSFRVKFGRARDTAQAALNTSLLWLAKRVNTKVGTPVVVYNTLSWTRSDPVVCTVPAGAPSPFIIRSANGAWVSYQLLPGNKMTFIAESVPSYGYKTYYCLAGGRTPVSGHEVGTAWSAAYHNNFYQITPSSGGISSIYDKQLHKELLLTNKFKGAELVDFGVNFGPKVDFSDSIGAGNFQSFNGPRATGYDKMSSYTLVWTCTESGPLRIVFETSRTMPHYTFKLRLIAYKTIKRIDFEPSIIGWDGAALRELRMFFPINSTMHDVAYDVPFAISKVGLSEINPSQYGWGSMHQPREVQNFMYAGGTGFGVTISTSVAPMDYMDPTLPPAANTIIQPLLLATRLECSNGAVWAQKGDHSYKFSLFSHPQGYENGWRLGVQANNPLLAVAPGTKDMLANLPESVSFCSVAQNNILVPVIKKSEDNNTSAVLRFYDYAGKSTSVAQIRFMATITAAEKTNMIEEQGQTIETRGHLLSMKVGAYSIETARITVDYNSLAVVGLKR